jgi:hypothetical protein
VLGMSLQVIDLLHEYSNLQLHDVDYSEKVLLAHKDYSPTLVVLSMKSCNAEG